MTGPQYLLRFDDICPTMNWRVWAEIESVLVEHRLQPILAVVPDNCDPELQVDAPADDFWERVRAWQDRGWTIAMHGYQHRYVSWTAGLASAWKRSEFAGLSAEVQREKLRRGMEIFERERITSRVWIGPSNTFDATTVTLLPEVGINIISAGYFQWPYVSPVVSRNGAHGSSPGALHDCARFAPDRGSALQSLKPGSMTWIPQQMHYFRPAPAGVWTVCYHHNQWNAAQKTQFHEHIDRYRANIVSLDEVLERNAPRESKWSTWLCTHPRLSEFLVRGELKLWAMTRDL
jgi:hypothetical protein